MSVLFPSSTLPAVQMRSSPEVTGGISKVTFPFLQLHRAVLVVIDDAKLPFGLARGNELLDDLRQSIRLGTNRSRARRAAEGSHAAHDRLRLLAGHGDDKRLFLNDQ